MAVQMVLLNQAVWSGRNGETVTIHPFTGIDDAYLAIKSFPNATGAVVALEKGERGQVIGVACAAIYCAIAPYDAEELVELAITAFEGEPHLRAALSGKSIAFRSVQFPGFDLRYPFSEEESGALYGRIYVTYVADGCA